MDGLYHSILLYVKNLSFIADGAGSSVLGLRAGKKLVFKQNKKQFFRF